MEPLQRKVGLIALENAYLGPIDRFLFPSTPTPTRISALVQRARRGGVGSWGQRDRVEGMKKKKKKVREKPWLDDEGVKELVKVKSGLYSTKLRDDLGARSRAKTCRCK